MNELAINIEYLLLSHNNVIVPSLGMFRTMNTPARWVEAENLFLPPVRNVHFDPNITSDPDEIFLQSLSSIYSLTPEEALKRCESLVIEFHKSLITEGSVDFGSIGIFTIEDDATISMASCECGVITPRLYGLDTLHMGRLAQKAPQTQPETHVTPSPSAPTAAHTATAAAEDSTTETSHRNIVLTTEQPQDEHITIRLRRSVLRYAMAIAASILLFLIIQPTTTTHSHHATAAGHNASLPFLQPNMVSDQSPQRPNGHSLEQSTDQSPQQPTDPSFDAVLIDVTEQALNEGLDVASTTAPTQQAVPTQQAAPTQQAESKQTTTVTPTQPANNGEYVIVLASAISKANADDYIKRLSRKGIDATLIQTNLRRVVVPGFATEQQARAYMKTLKEQDKEEFGTAWLMKL